MSARKKPENFIQRLVRQIWRFFDAVTKPIINGFRRSLLALKRRSSPSQSGFVLPTVIMVILVVILLTTAILFRSFDRSKNASNYRVDEAVLRAATPALDRARAKLNRLFSPAEAGLQGFAPSEENIASLLQGSAYTFGDETPLKLQLRNPVGNDPDNPGDQVPPVVSAWKFAVDSDNNGAFDSFTLYGIYFHTPPIENNGNDKRVRTPVEARALPQQTGAQGSCAGANGGAGASPGWTPINGQLKKAFFTYVATIPITDQTEATRLTRGNQKYETYKGNKGFSGLEMQLDQARIALDNNAVWFEDDLALSNVPPFNINGRIFTNSNFMISSGGPKIKLRQVSSPDSCFYDPVNAKIIVAGNVAAGVVTQPGDNGSNNVEIDLYPAPKQAPTQTPSIDAANKTTNNNPPEVAANRTVFEQRLSVLTQGAFNKYRRAYPTASSPTVSLAKVQRVFNNYTAPDDYEAEISTNFKSKCPSDACEPDVLEQILDTYFKRRIRRVSYSEISFDDLKNDPKNARKDAGGRILSGSLKPPAGETYVFSGQPGVVPPQDWMLIDGDYTQLDLKYMPASEPSNNTKEEYIGDRVQVGNNLPELWLQDNNPTYAKPNQRQDVEGTITWTNSTNQRTRQGLARQLDDLGDTSRNGYWEKAAAKTQDLLDRDRDPAAQQLLGGLRVITGAGIYIDRTPGGTGFRVADGRGVAQTKSFLPPPPVTATDLKQLYPGAGINDKGPNKATVVWPDTMPMFLWKPYKANDPISLYTDFSGRGTRQPGEGLKGDLQMRASVVYHYTNSAGKEQRPIACISSYYDPTDDVNASNAQGLPLSTNPLGTSNNGVSYPPPPISRVPSAPLRRQANMIFPDGRWANPALRTAVENYDANPTSLTVADNAAFDAANCALGILDRTLSPGGSGRIPNGAIKERAFLDARQVKALHKAPAQTDDKGNLILDGSGNPIPIVPDTLLADITAPEKTKIAELASKANTPVPGGPSYSIRETDTYNLPIEQRQPLEIRVTEINLEALRTRPIGGNPGGGYPNNNQEYLLPNSGVIYATREDALPDISDVDLSRRNADDNGGSATDFKLDPTRRPNGILLTSRNNSGDIISVNLARDNRFRTAEKGLILASDLPVYIQGEFNPHYQAGSTTVVEEFQQKLQDDYGNFYTRRDPKDPSFACRPGQKPRCNPGDQWRPARILSDAVTLLSTNFRDGYRNEGDYDFNNNAGNSAVTARLKNGLWWNDFATSASWYNATGLPNQTSSYVTNGVTPIQRRQRFPEYLMEACTKKPVSECGTQDWVFAIQNKASQEPFFVSEIPATPPRLVDLTTTPYARNNNAGTTARPPEGIFESAVRRVAFKRNGFGALEVPDTCSGKTPATLQDCVAIAKGIDTTNRVRDYHAGRTPQIPRPLRQADNALWYWTTADNTNQNPSDSSSFEKYNKNNLLYYLPYDLETVSERQLLLPGTPVFPEDSPTIQAAGGATVAQALNALNGNGVNDPSDYSVCIPARGASKNYKNQNLNDEPLVGCNNANAAIGPARTALLQLQPRPDILPSSTVPRAGDFAPTLSATDRVNVLQLPADGILGNPANPGLTITLRRNPAQRDPIVVFKMPNNTPIYFGQRVELKLEGVDPNNIFWVSARGMWFYNYAHQLAGNFIGGAGPLRIEANPLPNSKITGRFLGFNRLTFKKAPLTLLPSDFLTALTTTNQPLLVPVLQLHSPKGSPSNTTATAFGSDQDHINEDWMPHALRTTFNASLVMGDTPSRPASGTNQAETNGGLANFPRLLEAWEDQEDNTNPRIAKIFGSFIQFKKSAFATAPYQAIDNPSQDTSLFFDGAPDYTADYVRKDYRYKGGAQDRLAPYYKPPLRQWGYDVGFLSQTPDLFSRRFGTPSAGTPNEYYRAVGRDDPWVQTLLCAAEQSTPVRPAGSPPPTFNNYAVKDPKQRPASCAPLPYNQPLS